MALATVDEVLETGGLDAVGDYRLFRLPDRPALEATVQKALNRARAYLKDRVQTTYYTGQATTNADRDELFKGAEELVALHFLVLRLKSRRVFGTHEAVDQEGSERFAELIDNEYLRQVELLIEPYVVIETEVAQPFFPGALIVTGAVDRSALRSVEERLDEELLDASAGFYRPLLAANPP